MVLRALIGVLLLMSVVVIPARAASVTAILGGNVGVPVLTAGSASIVCTPPAWCPSFFDNDAMVAGRYYGDAFSSSGGLSNNCRISTDQGATWTTLCAGAYPTANVPREMDVTALNTLLSLRYESSALNLCRLDRSNDGGASWTTIVIASGAGFSCRAHNSGYLLERLRCGNATCLAIVGTGANTFVYRSVDDGLSWSLVHTGPAFWVPGEMFFNGTTGVFSFVAGGDDTFSSADGGGTWATKSGDVASVTNCGGIAQQVTAPSNGGISIGCLVFPTTRFTLLNFSGATVFQPGQPTIYTYNGTNQVSVRSRISGHVYFVATTSGPSRGRLFVSTNGGGVFEELAVSVSGAIDPIGSHCARPNGRELLFSTNGNTFASTQMLRAFGGD